MCVPLRRVIKWADYRVCAKTPKKKRCELDNLCIYIDGWLPAYLVVGLHQSMGLRVIERSGWTLPLYKIWSPSEHPNPFICSPQVQWFYIEKGDTRSTVQSIQMGVKKKKAGSVTIYRGLWSIEIKDRWYPPVGMHHKTQGKGVHLLSFKTYGLIC